MDFFVSLVLCKLSPTSEIHPPVTLWKKVIFLQLCMSTKNVLNSTFANDWKKSTAKIIFAQNYEGILLLSSFSIALEMLIAFLILIMCIKSMFFSSDGFKIFPLSLIFWNCIINVIWFGAMLTHYVGHAMYSFNLTDFVLNLGVMFWNFWSILFYCFIFFIFYFVVLELLFGC